MAERAGVSLAGVRDLEQGRVRAPRKKTLKKLASALGLSPRETDDLLRLLHEGSRRGSWLWISVLGPLIVTVDGSTVELGSPRQRALLGLLAVSVNQVVGREKLIEQAWGTSAPRNANELLQTDISRLRARLKSSHRDSEDRRLLAAVHHGYQLNLDQSQLDLLVFRDLVSRAHELRVRGDLDDAFEELAAALALWRGLPLAYAAGFESDSAVVPLVGEWRKALVTFSEIASEIGRHDEALPALRTYVALNPLDERAHAQLMLRLAGSGHQAGALAVFDDMRRRLASETGATPGEDLKQAHQLILRQDYTRGGTTAAPVVARRQLPCDIRDFTGREEQLRALHHRVVGGASRDEVAIVALQGMGGVGKTRLAVRLAHQLVADGHFDEQQLYVDLRGHAPEPPADPHDVIGSFLQLLGVPGSEIPEDIETRAEVYRDCLRDRCLLLLLDNAASPEQVLPLLPPAGANAVIVTSRRALNLRGATSCTLDVFMTDEAESLLAQIVGREQVAADPDAAGTVIELCGRLPLAINLVARRLQSRSAWRLGDVASRLRARSTRLEELAAGNRQVKAAFDLSYDTLPYETRRVFRLLGVHPGDEFSAGSAAALTNTTPDSIARTLRTLVDEHLVTRVAQDRYRIHDLLRAYANELVADEFDRRDALERVLLWCLRSARQCERLLRPGDALSEPYDSDFRVPEFDDADHAFHWLDNVRETMCAAVIKGHERGFVGLSWRIAVVLHPYFERLSNWDLWIDINRVALASAREDGDRRGEALVLSSLALAYGQRGDLERSIDMVTCSRDILHDIGDREGEARSLNNLGVAWGMRGNLNEAIRCFEAALPIARELGEVPFTGRVLSNLGHAHVETGEPLAATPYLEESLDIRKNVDDPVGIGLTLQTYGSALAALGRPEEAIDRLFEARDLHQASRATQYQAQTLELLGEALAAAGRTTEAHDCWHDAAAILESLNEQTKANEVRSRLDHELHANQR